LSSGTCISGHLAQGKQNGENRSCLHEIVIIIAQANLFCSKSASRFLNSRNSRCIPKVKNPTKTKHIGKNEKKAGRHQPESGGLLEADNAVNEMNAQNAAGTQ